MVMKKQSHEKGIIKIIILIVVALLILSYFGISLRALINAPVTQDNISYTTTSSVSIWNTYLKQPATYLWNEIFLNLIWNPAIDSLKNLKNNPGALTSPTTGTSTTHMVPL